MNTEAIKVLEIWAREIREEAEAFAASVEDLIAEGLPVHQVLVDQGKRVTGDMELAMEENATLFEASLDDAERKIRLEIDEAFRLRLKTIRKLLQLPRREG